MTDYAPIPRLTEPVTAYHFLTETLVKVVRDEPRRMFYRTWITTPDAGRSTRRRLDFPDCGTVGCVGGWTELLVAGKMTWGLDSAHYLLGLTAEQGDDLFMNQRLWASSLLDKNDAAHAEKIIAHILRFAEEHKAQLMGHIVEPHEVSDAAAH